ncbi:ATP-binding protein [Halorubrum sp. Ea8]|uniref:sensor histidine kinase n=1 Tax=Halorubrum sp. Ea8 TaxID=1383841 RepID=UPI000B9892DA|nr:ATP-binding protein [Halorubrum sp. Ea8]OYR51978.1 histidine kinase [Halorubrum sp. Ea8]
MPRRSAVVYVGDDTNVRRRVREAVADAWSAPRTPEYGVAAPAALAPVAEEERSPLADACGIVTTADALASGDVRRRLAATPESVPVIVAVEEPGVELTRTVIDAGADDVVRVDPNERAETDGSCTDSLVERLRDAIEPALTRLGADDVVRLREALLDAGTTLMSTRSDEVETKIVWTMEQVGRQVEVDRIICYLDAGDAFEPAYHWSSGNCDPGSKSYAEFPGPEALSTFENVVRPPISAGKSGDATPTDEGPLSDTGSPPGANAGSVPGAGDGAPPATVHVPLVSDWELIGVLALETDEPRAWTEDEVAAYRTFGDLIAHTLARNERRLELRRQTERLEQFSAVVSHDLRNPLNVLSGYLDLVEDDVARAEYEAMERAVHRMETLIEDLLMLAKRGDAIDETESVPVASLAEGAWDCVRAPKATLTVGDDVGHVEADPERLRQLFENLFRNAVDHGGPDVNIEVGTDGGGSGARGLYVADDGPGVPPDARDSLFDSGFSTAGSSGLGLAIVDRIADAHGWVLEVRNDGGAVFELTFGAETAAAPA